MTGNIHGEVVGLFRTLTAQEGGSPLNVPVSQNIAGMGLVMDARGLYEVYAEMSADRGGCYRAVAEFMRTRPLIGDNLEPHLAYVAAAAGAQVVVDLGEHSLADLPECSTLLPSIDGSDDFRVPSFRLFPRPNERSGGLPPQFAHLAGLATAHTVHRGMVYESGIAVTMSVGQGVCIVPRPIPEA